jgi:multicomponent Na+:H+ antiporter subunit E
MRQTLGLAVVLSAFWLVLSGHYTALLLSFGALSIALVVWLARRMDIVDHEGRPLDLGLRAPANIKMPLATSRPLTGPPVREAPFPR